MVKTPDELALMQVSGKLLASVFEMLDAQELAGLSTLQVNDLVDRFITVDLAARPASKGQYGFKYVLNCSINHVVCHGVPDPGEIIRDGDIITLDVKARRLDVQGDIESRRAQWKPPAPHYKTGVMAKYAKLVSSASQGAVTSAV